MTFFILYPILARGRCISVREQLQGPRANIGCDTKKCFVAY